MRQKIETLLNKKMTRKEFLQHIGYTLLSVGGIGSLLQYLSRNNFAQQQASNTYGAGNYEGE